MPASNAWIAAPVEEVVQAVQQGTREPAKCGRELCRYNFAFGGTWQGTNRPRDNPFAVPWQELEKKMKVPAIVKKIRGKLNVPPERLRTFYFFPLPFRLRLPKIGHSTRGESRSLQRPGSSLRDPPASNPAFSVGLEGAGKVSPA